MTQKATISKHKLQAGDYIGFDVLTNDIDSSDCTVWCEITNILTVDGFKAYQVMFPNNELKRMPVLAKHVTKLKRGNPCEV